MISDLAVAFWFFLPAAVANAAPVFAKVIPIIKRFNAPIDGGKTWRGYELFGAHKTWRGLISGAVAATLILWLQQLAYAHTTWGHVVAGPVIYPQLPLFILGPLFGIGALGGDLVESFWKRQAGKPSGQRWIPFDQLDYIIGAVLVSLPFVRLSLSQYCGVFIIWFSLHVIATYIGWMIGLRDDPI